MKAKLILPIILAAIYLSSCTVMGSLYRLSENESRYIFKREFIGKWIEAGDTSVQYDIDTLPNYNGKIYTINIIDTINEEPDTTFFVGYIVNIGGRDFLDCWVNLKSENDKNLYLVPKHFVLGIRFKNTDRLEITYFDSEEIATLLEKQKIHLTYASRKFNLEDENESYLILDKPAVLQKELKESFKFPKIYKDKVEYYRLK